MTPRIIHIIALGSLALAGTALPAAAQPPVLPRPPAKQPSQPPAAGAPAPETPAQSAPSAPAASPPSPADIEKAKQHFERGKQLFGKKDFAGAVTEFKESYRLSRNPLLLYNIGYTLDQLDDRSMALFYYRKYVQDAPKEDANRPTAESRIQVLEREIEEASLAGRSTGAPAAGQPGGAVDEFQHNVIDEAPPGKPIDVSAFVPAGSTWQVTLFFRAAGEGVFSSVQMRPRYNELVGRIPAAKTVGASVQYYIEARDVNGKIVDRSGRALSPHLILFDPNAKPHYYSDLGEETAKPAAGAATATASAAVSLEPEVQGEGWLDAGSTRFSRLKWGATGGALGMVALSATFYLLSSSASHDIEDEAEASTSQNQCIGGVPPCRSFSDDQQDIEGRGKRFETLAHISLGVGATAAAAAGVFWFLDIRHGRRGREAAHARGASFTGAPVVTSDFLGGAAEWRF